MSRLRFAMLPFCVWLLCVPSPSFGEVIKLICRSATGSELNFAIDTKLKSVTNGKDTASTSDKVYIDAFVMTFKFHTGWGGDSYVINRENGSMDVVTKDGEIRKNFMRCVRLKQKF